MIKNNVFMLSLALAILIIIPSALAFTYNITYFDNSETGNNVFTNPPSFYSNEADNIILSQDLFFSFNTSSAPNTYSATYISPFNITIAISSGSLSNNISCLNIGTVSNSFTGTDAEGRNTMTHDADATSFISTGNRYFMTNSQRFINISSDNLDSEGFRSNLYFVIVATAGSQPTENDITSRFNSGNFGECISLGVARVQNNIPVSPGAARQFAYTLFNATAGNTSIFATIYDTSSLGGRVVVYPFDDPATIIDSCAISGSSGTQVCNLPNLNLESSRLYVLGEGWEFPSLTDIDTPSFDIIVDSGLADYECPAFGECIGGFQTRTCIDNNGLQPDLVENQACSLVISQNATLGFEEFFSTSDILKCEPQWLFGCSYIITNVTLDRPLNWTIIDPAYGGANFLQMTQEYATEGTRSLKMWQIPPKQGEVLTNVTCGNLTTSVIPQILQGVSNDIFFVSHNVTFPATNMQISFDVKRCSDQVVQHTALTSLFNLITLCPKQCYSDNCTTELRGRYVFNVLDTTTSQSIFGVPQYNDAGLQTLSPTYSIANLGIIPGRTYNIVFAISNENPNDATGNCVYIDNVRYQVTEQSLLDFVPDCESRCTETTRIEATRTVSGSCFIVTQEFSPLCVDQATAEAIENQEDFCSDTTTLQTFNEKTGKPEPIICSSGFICSPLPPEVGNPGSCITEEEAAVDDSTVPAEDTATFLVWFNWLFSPLFIFLIITFILAGIISKATTGEDGKGTFEIFGSVIILMIIIGTLPGIAIVPIWISVAIIVIVALLIAQIMGIFGGKD